jgi:hypothetical protein
VLVRLDRPILLKSQRWYQSAARRRVRLTVEPLAPIATQANGNSATLARLVEGIFRKKLDLTAEDARTVALPVMPRKPDPRAKRFSVQRRN